MIGNIIGVSVIEADLGKNHLIRVVGNSPLIISICGVDSGHGFTMICYNLETGRGPSLITVTF